jgi:hypothetical protein
MPQSMDFDKTEFPHGMCPFMSQSQLAPVQPSGSDISRVDGQPAMRIGSMTSFTPCVGADCALWFKDANCCGAYTNGVATQELMQGLLGSHHWHSYAQNSDALMIFLIRTIYTRLNDLLDWKILSIEKNELVRGALMNLQKEVERIRLFAACLPGEGVDTMTMESFGKTRYAELITAVDQVERNVRTVGRT